MKRKVIWFFTALIAFVLILAILEVYNFGSIVGFTSFSDESELPLTGESYGYGLIEYENKNGEYVFKFLVKDLNGKEHFIDFDYGWIDNGVFIEKENKIVLGANDEQEVVLKVPLEKEKFILEIKLDDGNEVLKDKLSIGSSAGISSFAVKDDFKDNMFSVYGVVFILLILFIFIFEFFYKSLKKRKSFVSHGFGRKVHRKTIKLDMDNNE